MPDKTPVMYMQKYIYLNSHGVICFLSSDGLTRLAPDFDLNGSCSLFFNHSPTWNIFAMPLGWANVGKFKESWDSDDVDDVDLTIGL